MNDNDPLGPVGSELHRFLAGRERRSAELVDRLSSDIPKLLKWTRPISIVAFAIACVDVLFQVWDRSLPNWSSLAALLAGAAFIATLDRLSIYWGMWRLDRHFKWILDPARP